MVHTSEVRNLMDHMMKVDIFNPTEKERMTRDEERTFLDPNVIMDARHRILRENLLASRNPIWDEAKKLLTQEEEAQLFMKKQQRFLERELKKFQTDLSKTRPKFLDRYACSRRNLAPSDDEDFWGTTGRQRNKVVDEENRVQIDTRGKSVDSSWRNVATDNRAPEAEAGKCLVTKKCEVPCIGSIKVTIKDKTNVDTDGDRLCLLKKYFEILKCNAAEQRRLREMEMKIKGNAALRMAKKYYDVWRTRTRDARNKTEKVEEEVSDERKIEMFISAITERQRELMKSQKPRERDSFVAKDAGNANPKKRSACYKRVVVESPAQSRLNAQKQIIERQKAKLAEQSRIIEELKLQQMQKEISKANRETVDMAKDTLAHCGEKTRRNLIRLLSQNGYRDECLNVPPRPLDPPKFLMRMEARAEARRRRIKLNEESRRRKMEEQKRNEEIARMEEEEKKRRLQQEALAEARRSRKELEENRRREAEKFQRLNAMADEHYRKYLLRNCIIRPLVKLVEEERIDTRKAEDHCRGNLLKQTFSAWKSNVDAESNVKNELALLLYNKNLITSMFVQWRETTREAKSKYQVAADFYDMRLLEKYFKLWLGRTIELETELEGKARLADDLYRKKLKANYFDKWRKYLTIIEDIEESERRKDELRQLVQKVIPDFNPKERGVALED